MARGELEQMLLFIQTVVDARCVDLTHVPKPRPTVPQAYQDAVVQLASKVKVAEATVIICNIHARQLTFNLFSFIYFVYCMLLCNISYLGSTLKKQLPS